MRVQLYCEMIPIPELLSPPFTQQNDTLFSQLREHLSTSAPVELELVLRVVLSESQGCQDFEAVSALLAEPAQHLGLDAIRLWPQLARADGVYLNAYSLGFYFEGLNKLLARLVARGLPAPDLLFDLEPPMALMAPMLNPESISWKQALRLPQRLRKIYRAGAPHNYSNHLETSLRELKKRYGGHHVAAVAPTSLAGQTLQPQLERWMGCPTQNRGRPLFDALDAMCYGSLVGLVKASKRSVFRRGVERHLVSYAAARHRHWCRALGTTPGIILGCTSHGLFGHEPYYTHPEALAAAAQAAGRCERIGVYNLRGLLAEPGQPLGSRDWRAWSAAVLGESP